MSEQRSRTLRRRFQALAAGLLLAGLGAAAGTAEEWSANVRVIEAQLRGFALERFDLGLPQLRAFDREGRLVFSMDGYDRKALDAAMPVLLEGRAAVPENARTLAKELALVTSAAGKRLPPPPAAEVTVVDYWAEWCAPCRVLSRDLERHFAARPEVQVNLIRVETDQSKLRARKAGDADSAWDGN